MSPAWANGGGERTSQGTQGSAVRRRGGIGPRRRGTPTRAARARRRAVGRRHCKAVGRRHCNLCCNGAATPALLQLLGREHGLDVDARGFRKRTPLLAMCQQNDAVSAELLGALVALGADVRATNKAGSTVLQLLCCNGEATPALLQLLVREHGLGVDARGVHKRKPLLAMLVGADAVGRGRGRRGLVLLGTSLGERLAPRLLTSVGAVFWYCEPTAHTASAVHSRLLLAVPAVVWYPVLRHVVWSVQARVDVDVAAAVSYWPPLHVVSGAHARLDVEVLAVVSYSLAMHTVSKPHSRSALAVPSEVWYCVSRHVAWLVHARSVVSVGAVDSNWSALHVASADARLDVAVAAVDSYCTPAVQVASAAHWRFVVLVGAAVWYCDVVEHELRALHSRS